MGEIDRRQEIGRNIRVARERVGLSQKALAERVGGDVSRLSRIESGARGIDSVLLFDLADALEVSVDSLLAPGRSAAAFARAEHQPGQDDPHVRWGVELIEDMQAAERLVRRYGL